MEQILLWITELRDILIHHPLFTIGAMLILGFIFGKLASRIKLPAITGFILAGILMGKSVTGIVSHEMEESLKGITEIALGLIAITIGGEFSFSKLKRSGRDVLVITLFQLLITFFMVTIATWVFGIPIEFALLLGVISAATAPAATVAVVQSLKARGKFVDYLYGVVALDDAGCVILFGIIFSIVSGMLGAGDGHGKGAMIFHAFAEVGFSLLIGLIAGFLIHAMTIKRSNNNEILIITLSTLFLSTGIAVVFHLSPLLTNMAAGAILINLSPRNHRIFRILEPLTPPIYALFFIIAGAELDPTIMLQVSVLVPGMVFILSRALGKYFGVYLGAAVVKTDSRIRKYMGLSMIPQAGVAIGLVLTVNTAPSMMHLSPESQQVLSTMVNIILLSVFVNELIGPVLSKIAIVKGTDLEV